MRLARWLVVALLVVALGPATARAAPDRWIVAVADEPTARAIAAASGAREVDRVLGIWTAPAPVAHRLADRLRAAGLLRFEEADRPVAPAATRTGPAVLHDAAAAAWWRPRILGTAGEVVVGPTGPAAAPVAVIETGAFDATHPDIPPSVTLRRPPGDPDAAHGTAVVSVIAGRGPGVLGVNPGSDVRVYGGVPFCSDLARAGRQAARDGAKVISMSYGFFGPGTCLAHRVATNYAASSAVLVASAGNERAQPWVQPGNDLHILTVAALNAIDQPTGFTHQSANTDLSAPGEGIGVACPVGVDTVDGAADGLCTASGTSFSAPMVAAVAARVSAARPDLSPQQVARLVADTATDIGPRPGWDFATGYGLVNLTAALAAPAPIHDYLEPNDDIEWVDGRRFTADPPLLRKGRRLAFSSTVHALEDPVDVYPAWVGPRERLEVSARPLYGAVRLSIHDPGAVSVSRSRDVIASARIRPLRTGRVLVDNAGRRGRKVWVSVYLPRGGQFFAPYDHTLRRR
jgi:hypothetical protein